MSDKILPIWPSTPNHGAFSSAGTNPRSRRRGYHQVVLDPVPERPRASVSRIVEDLGSTLLELVYGDADVTGEVDSVVIHDPFEAANWPRNAIVLGVGVREPERVVELLDELGEQNCAALVLRSPAPTGVDVREAARRSGVAVLALTRGASWAQLAAMLRSLIGRDEVGGVRCADHGDAVVGDLFALANAVAALLDAPVTIEDRSSRILAFSNRQDEADRSRVDSILGHRVPEPSTSTLEAHGVFRELYRSDQPLFVDPSDHSISGFTMPRVALAVRAGDEILGSIWAAVPAPLDEKRSRTFQEVGKLVALHLLAHRANADVERRRRADLVDAVLTGGPAASGAVSQLGLAGQRAVVLALAVSDHGRPLASTHAGRVAERQHLADAFAMHLTAAHVGAATALLGEVTYGILPLGSGRGNGPLRATRLAADFVERTGSRARAVIGIGLAAAEPSALARSRSEADRALRVLRTGTGDRRVASIDEVGVDALLIELSDIIAARNDGVSGPIARLMDYDAKHRTYLVATLRAWLDAFGDVIAASRAVCVHPNTFRYRLRRLAEVGGIDLDDPDARFAAAVQLRLIVRPITGHTMDELTLRRRTV